MVARSAELAAAFTANFEELWSTRDVSRTGRAEPRALEVDGHPVRAWFTPGHGEDLSHRIAAAIGRARTRVRIASPVITAGPGDRHARRGGRRGRAWTCAAWWTARR